MKLEINYRKKTGKKPHKHLQIKHATKKQWINEEIKEEITYMWYLKNKTNV